MARLCTICTHPLRRDIDRALLSTEPVRQIEKRFDIPEPNLRRHRDRHLSKDLRGAVEAVHTERRQESVLDSVRQQFDRLAGLFDEGRRILDEAKKGKDHGTQLKAVRELTNLSREERETYELIARLTGELDAAKYANGAGPAITIVMPAILQAAPQLQATQPKQIEAVDVSFQAGAKD